jgi:NAD(P)-dependent dehydrogenase (short-subunit alcohol dehydrogenase family)
MARQFAADGCRVAICARDEQELERARHDLADRGADCIAIACDVTDPEQVKRLLDRVIREFGRIDVLVNNTGQIQVGPVESMTLEDFHRAMDVMFWGTVHPTVALLPHMLSRRSGRIVNITSIGGKVAVPHLLPYNCAKFAAVGFSEGLRAEMAGKGIKVVTIAPGLMRTGSYANAEFKGDADKESMWFGLSANMPLMSMSGEKAAKEIVDATRRGDAEKILTVPAQALAKAHGVAPALTSGVLGLVARMVLPSATGGGKRRGFQTRIWNTPLAAGLTMLGRLAAKRFLQPPATQAAPARS